jgi:hypothetical protein
MWQVGQLILTRCKVSTISWSLTKPNALSVEVSTSSCYWIGRNPPAPGPGPHPCHHLGLGIGPGGHVPHSTGLLVTILFQCLDLASSEQSFDPLEGNTPARWDRSQRNRARTVYHCRYRWERYKRIRLWFRGCWHWASSDDAWLGDFADSAKELPRSSRRFNARLNRRKHDGRSEGELWSGG